MSALPVAFVYALMDADGAPRYVGSTADPEARLRYHWSHRRDPRKAVNTWLGRLPEPPTIELLAVVPHDQRLAVEERLTDLFRESGAPLLNVVSGGAALTGWHHGPETRAKIAAGVRAHWARKRAERGSVI
ncbi:GIY-YIG nuclease family protein [Streptomyces sp. B1-3]|uniref:GIY-YIG nuclease family protein n=1 Tax=Streptomyces sp. B1-3 TaxID=3141453 RepID=UPI003D2720FF